VRFHDGIKKNTLIADLLYCNSQECSIALEDRRCENCDATNYTRAYTCEGYTFGDESENECEDTVLACNFCISTFRGRCEICKKEKLCNKCARTCKCGNLICDGECFYGTCKGCKKILCINCEIVNGQCKECKSKSKQHSKNRKKD